MKKTIIRGTGRYLPSRVVTNDDLAKLMETSDEWIKQRTGIEKRHWTPEEGGVGSSDLGLEAAKIALDRAGWKAEDLDFIIFATLSPDIYFPGPGCLLQHKLGLFSTPALDIRQQCTGFLYGLATADSYIKSGLANKILLVGAEVHSTGLDISTRGRDVTVIFGDGAAALCLEGVETDENVGLLSVSLYAEGKYADNLSTEFPASRCNPRLTEESLRQGLHYAKMDGKNIFKLAVRRLPETANKCLKDANLLISDIDLVIPHQANLRINQAFQQAMNLPEEKVFHNIQRYGNTTAASIPIALDEAIEMNLIGKGSTVLFIGLGAGLTWGGIIYKFPK
ncbi:MAG: ketoacyl-ACP synthase III [Desulfobacterales bacterium]|nr:ketoacyl-ACP synthase III [Desulfobacterales bacterium]MBF0398948.1 ketoacyl-ACP synthase III [Desulfobacterales bacterium]